MDVIAISITASGAIHLYLLPRFHVPGMPRVARAPTQVDRDGERDVQTDDADGDDREERDRERPVRRP